jgi:hypothetical protein
MTRTKLIWTLSIVSVLATGAAIAQNRMVSPSEEDASSAPPKPTVGSDTLQFGSNVGSFKVLPFNDEKPTKGTLSFSFNGSVLVSGLNGQIKKEGDVREEYKNDKYGKQLYFGKGKLTITGEVRSVQFFGRDVRGTLKGEGLITFYGEFDKNLDTGWIQYEGGDRTPWGTGGLQKQVPEVSYSPANDLKIEKSG